MVHEFAIDPSCASSFDVLRYLLDQCAVHLGRYVSDFPKRRWEIEVREHLQLEGIALRRLEETLVQLRRRGGLIDVGRTYDFGAGWLDNALREHDRRKFRAIITAASPADPEFILDPDHLTPDTPLWNVETQDRIPRTAEALVKSVLPLIHLSQEILLVDPRFHPDKARFRESLKALVSGAHTGGRSYRRLEVHTNVQEDNRFTEKDWLKKFREDCHEELPKCLPSGIQIQVVWWRRKSNGEGMHARYVMTEHGAIYVDWGLDRGKPEETTDIGLLSPKLYRERWEQLQLDSQAYDLVERIEIRGVGS